MDIIRQIFEASPLFAGFVALVILTIKRPIRMTHDVAVIRTAIYTVIIMLFIAQSSWAMTVAAGYTIGTFVANIIWTLFNLLVCALFAVWAYRGIK